MEGIVSLLCICHVLLADNPSMPSIPPRLAGTRNTNIRIRSLILAIAAGGVQLALELCAEGSPISSLKSYLSIPLGLNPQYQVLLP